MTQMTFCKADNVVSLVSFWQNDGCIVRQDGQTHHGTQDVKK